MRNFIVNLIWSFYQAAWGVIGYWLAWVLFLPPATAIVLGSYYRSPELVSVGWFYMTPFAILFLWTWLVMGFIGKRHLDF